MGDRSVATIYTINSLFSSQTILQSLGSGSPATPEYGDTNAQLPCVMGILFIYLWGWGVGLIY